MKKFLLGTLMTLISLGGSIAQDNPDLKKPGYEITMKSNGVKQGDKIRLAVYTGEYSNFADSTYVGPNNTFVFKGAKRFTGGFYYVVLPSQKFFEVVIDQDQHFAVEADTADLTKIKFTGSAQKIPHLHNNR